MHSEGDAPYTLDISQCDSENVKFWQKGEKLLIGGVWQPEFDTQGISNCGMMFVLYNYDTKQLARFEYETPPS